MKKALKNIRRAHRTALVPFFVSQAIFAVLVGAIVTVLLATDAAPGMSSGMTFSAVAAIIPFSMGLSMTLQHSVVVRSKDFRSLLNLGASEKRLRRSLVVEVLFGSLVSGVLAAILGAPLLRLAVATLYGKLGGEMPTELASPLIIGVVAAVVVGIFSLLGIRRAVKNGLRVRPVQGEPAPRWFRGVTFKSWFLLVMTIAFGVAIVIAPRDMGPVSVLAYIAPLTFAGASAVLLIAWLKIIEKVSRKASAWSPLSLAARESVAVPAYSVFAVLVLFICFPLALFTTNSAAIDAARTAAEAQGTQATVLTAEDGKLLTQEDANQQCESLGDQCIGTVNWSFGKEGDFVSEDDANEYVLTGNERALDALVENPESTVATSPFSADYLVPWGSMKASEEKPDSQGAMIVVDGGVEDIDGAEAHTARDALHDLPEGIFYGPGGTGTAEFIPLFAAVILGTSVLVFALFLGRQRLYTPMLTSLRGLGMTAQKRTLVRTLANVVVTIGALIASLLFGLVSYSLMLSTFGHFRIAFPALPLGLVIYLVGVTIVATLLVSFVDSRKLRT